jgi:hypothetical protein
MEITCNCWRPECEGNRNTEVWVAALAAGGRSVEQRVHREQARAVILLRGPWYWSCRGRRRGRDAGYPTPPSRPGEFHPEPLTGRVEDWRRLLRRLGLSVTLRFR